MKKGIFNIKSGLKLCLFLSLLAFSACDEDDKDVPEIIGEVPTVKSLAPSQDLRPGDLITITGTLLDQVKQLRIGSSYLLGSDDFEASSSATSLVFALPAQAPAGEVYLVSASQTIPNVLAGSVTLVKPIISEVSPLVVDVAADVVIKGSDLDLVSTISIGDVILTDLIINETNTEIQATCPENIQGGVLVLTMANNEEIEFGTPLTLYVPPVLPEIASVSDGFLGGTITIAGSNLDMVTSVSFGEGNEVTDFVSQTAFNLEVLVPATAPTGDVTITLDSENGAVESPVFNILGIDPAQYVFFDFDSKNLGWKDLGDVISDADLSVDGSQFYEVNATVDGNWATYFADNTAGRLNLEGVSADGYAVKMDVNVINISSGIVLKFRLGSYWYVWNIGDAYSASGTDGWTTVYFPLNQFKDDNGNGTALTTAALNDASVVNEWALTAGWNGGDVHVRIDNVGFDVMPE